MPPLASEASHAPVHRVRYEKVARRPQGEPPERFVIDLSAEGRAQLSHELGPIRRSWSARTEVIVWKRLLTAMENMPTADTAAESPPDEPGRRLLVFGATPQPKTVTWDDGADSARASAILDSLIAQIGNLPSDLVTDTLPRLTHRRVPEAPIGLPGQEATAVFGTVGGQPSFALARPGGGFAVFSVEPLSLLAETVEAGRPIHALTLGSDGGRDLLVTGGDDGTVWAWDLTGDAGLVHARGGHGGAVGAVTSRLDLADDGLVYSAGEDGDIRAWGGQDGEDVGALTGHGQAVNALATARVADLNLLVSGGDDGTVRLWSTDTGESLATFAPATEWINAIAVAEANGRGLVAAAGADHVIRVRDITTSAWTRELRGHSAAVTGLAFLDAGDRTLLASCSYDGTVRTWDVADGRAVHEWSAQDDWPAALATAPSADGAVIVSGGASGRVHVWDAEGTRLRVLAADGAPVQALAAAELDGQTTAAVGYLDGSLKLLELATGSPRWTLDPDDGPVTSVAFGGAGGTVVCGTARGTVRVHSTADGELRQVPTPHTDTILALGSLPGGGGILASAGVDRTVRTWEAATGRPLLRLRAHEAAVTLLAAGRAGAATCLASADADGQILVWDAESGQILADFRTERPLGALVFGALDGDGYGDGDGVLAAAERHGPVHVWDVLSGDETATLGTDRTDVVTLAVCTLDGTTALLTASRDGRVRAWRLPDGAEMGGVSLAQTPLELCFVPPRSLHVAATSGLTTMTLSADVLGPGYDAYR